MANLIGTVIGIAFCALLLAAGANFIAPKGFVEHNQAAANTAQVSALVTDYSNLAMALGRRPTYADYASVYSSGRTANATYTNSGGQITTSATMAYTDANGKTVPIGTWQFMPGCDPTGTQDCFCLPVTNATDVTYQATRISALNQMNSTTQSRIEFSTDQCASTASPVTNPVVCASANATNCWPSTAPANGYFLTVRLNGTSAGGGPTPVTPVPGACSSPLVADTCASGSTPQSYNASAGSWVCASTSGGAPASCQMPAVPGACSSPLVADTCATGSTPSGYNASAGTWTCNGQYGGSPAACSIAATVPGACSSPLVADTCATGSTPQSYNASAGSWVCTSNSGGTTASCQMPAVPGTCSNPLVADTCAPNSTPQNYNASAGTWNCNGQYGGSTAACSIPIPGICDTTQTPADVGQCTSGTASATSTPSPGYTTTWGCSGKNGGSDASPSCSATNAVCDESNPSTPGNCLSGKPSATSTSGTNTVWTCTGTYGSTASCTVPTTPGTGTYCPTYGTCSATCGTPGTQSVTYTCTDQNGNTLPNTDCPGMPANTTRVCNTTSGCTYPDISVYGPTTTDGEYYTISSSSCANSQGQAAPSKEYCSAIAVPKELNSVAIGNGGHYAPGVYGNGSGWNTVPILCSTSCGTGTASLGNWNCYSSSSGDQVDQSYCTAAGTAPQSGGACITYAGCTYTATGTATSFTCTRSDGSVADNSYCTPPSTCTASTTPTQPTPPSTTKVNGACGTTQYACTAGTAASETDDGTTSTWICDGSGGGSNASCSSTDTVAGVCGTWATGDLCVKGRPTDPTSTTTTHSTGGTVYTEITKAWECSGVQCSASCEWGGSTTSEHCNLRSNYH